MFSPGKNDYTSLKVKYYNCTFLYYEAFTFLIMSKLADLTFIILLYIVHFYFPYS